MALSGRKKQLRTVISASGLMSSIRSFITSVLYMPIVFVVAIIWRFMFVISTLSLSISSNFPTPLLISASHTYPPTPPIPKTATRLFSNFSIASLPSNILVLKNLSGIFTPSLFKVYIYRFRNLLHTFNARMSRLFINMFK